MGDTYQVESSKAGVYYEIDLKKNTCTCLHYIHRVRRAGGDCKHLSAVKEYVTGDSSFDEIINFVKENVFVDTIELTKKFGDEKINNLIKMGELVEDSGKVRLL